MGQSKTLKMRVKRFLYGRKDEWSTAETAVLFIMKMGIVAINLPILFGVI